MIEVRRVSGTQLDGVSLFVVFYNGICKKVYARNEKEAIKSIEEKEIEGIEEERKAYLAELGKSKGGHRK